MNAKFLLLFLLLLPVVFGLSFEGEKVVYENDYARLEVWPFLDKNIQENPTFSQNFKITNKTNQDRNLFFAFVFNKPLISAKAFNLEPVIKTRDSFGWVKKSFKCDYDFNFYLNVFPGSINPNSLNCFDVNAEGLTYIKKDFPFYSGNPTTKTALFYAWDINGIEEYSDSEFINRSNYFNFYYSPYLKKAFYYIKIPYKFNPLRSNEFKIFYQPDSTDLSHKWDLIAWSGLSWDCILFDSCDAVYLLDPNWLKVEASSRYPINISMGASGSDTNTTFKLNVNIIDLGLTVSSDINRLLIFDQSKNTEIARAIDLNKTTGDLNIFFKPLIPLAPNSDYNGTDFNGLKIYVVDSNYSDQNDNWNNVFWFGTTFEKPAEVGDWNIGAGDDTWTYPSTTQLDKTTGIVKKVVFGADSGSDAQLLGFRFNFSSDYNIFVQADINTNYWGKVEFHTFATDSGANRQAFEVRTTDGDLRVQSFTPTIASDFGVSTLNYWHRIQWTINDKNNSGNIIGQTASGTIPNSLNPGNIFALKLDSFAGYFSEWDNIRIYKILLNPPTIILGAEEKPALTPDLNLNYPVGAETFYKTQSYDINFSIQDGDSNSFLIDLNIFQDTNNFILLNDVNTDSATISCESTDFSVPVTCIYSWIIQEGIVSGDWNLTVFVSDGTNTAQDSTLAVFTITIIPEPSISEESIERYLTEEDPRFIDSNRFMAGDDLRLEDSNRFFQQTDPRQEASVFNEKVLFKDNQNIIIVVLGIILIVGLVWLIWIKK